jgi:hypothetical protein
MPFPHEPPNVPADNPTGIYATSVEIPGSWNDRRVVIHFGGAESVLYLYVNGRAVGMGKDSRLPSEFDLTSFVAFGRSNTSRSTPPPAPLPFSAHDLPGQSTTGIFPRRDRNGAGNRHHLRANPEFDYEMNFARAQS